MRGVCRFGCLGAVFAVCGNAAADAPPVDLELPEGVLVTFPAGLREVPAPELPPGTPGTLERVFTDGAPLPLVITAQTGPAQPLASLPAEPGAWTQEFVRGLASVPGAYDVTLVSYAPQQSAVSWEFKVAGASLASRLLAEPDSAPFWAREAAVPGANVKLARCLLTQLLAGALSVNEAELHANYPAAATLCALPVERVEVFARTTGAPQFAPAVSVISGVAFLTPSNTVLVLSSAPLDRREDARAAAAFVLQSGQVAPDARLPVATSGSENAFGLGRLVGIVLGSFAGALALTWAGFWLLAKSGMGTQRAFAICGAVLVALGIAGVTRSDTSLESVLRLGSYVGASGVAYQFFGNWRRLRIKPAASRSAAR